MPGRQRATTNRRRPRQGSRARRAERRVDPPSSSPGSGPDVESDATHHPLEDFAQRLLGRLLTLAQPVGRASGPVVLQFLEWQTLFLRAYQEAFRAHPPTAPLDEYLRLVARAMMGTYLEVAKTMPESREKMLAAHAAFVANSLETIEALKRRLGASE